MTNATFSLKLAQSLYQSNKQFPVNLDDAGVWLDYFDKYTAKRSFLNCGFVKGIDYTSAFRNRAGCLTDKRSDQNGAFPEVIKMTCDALKTWGMMANTTKGKQVRQYFLECERIAKQHNQDIQLSKEVEALISIFREFELNSPVVAKMAKDTICDCPKPPVTTQDDLNSSLVANRLGLAFNKHLKAFDAIQSATSPDAFNKMREQYQRLADDYQRLLATKTQTKTEYIEVPVVQVVEKVTEVESPELRLKVALLAEKFQTMKDIGDELIANQRYLLASHESLFFTAQYIQKEYNKLVKRYNGLLEFFLSFQPNNTRRLPGR